MSQGLQTAEKLEKSEKSDGKHGGSRPGAGRKPGSRTNPDREFGLLVWVRRRVAAKLSAKAKAKGISRSALIAEALTELAR